MRSFAAAATARPFVGDVPSVAPESSAMTTSTDEVPVAPSICVVAVVDVGHARVRIDHGMRSVLLYFVLFFLLYSCLQSSTAAGEPEKLASVGFFFVAPERLSTVRILQCSTRFDTMFLAYEVLAATVA